uniref:Uncharacterized protein n=1 Tax=Megaselia scalaris TaxID=36166 RepID=T1GXD1_MEGSC
MYLEQIYVHIQKDSSKYEPSFIDKVYELADKLKFYDPVMEKTFSDNNEVQFEDQEWLKNLRVLHEQNGLSTGFANNYIPQYQQPTYDYNNYESSLPTIPETGNVQQTPQEAIPENQFQNNYYQPEPVSMTNEGVHHGDIYGNYYQHQSQHQENVQQ